MRKRSRTIVAHLIAGALVLFYGVAWGSEGDRPKVLVSLFTNHAGVIAPQGRTLYAVVYVDGGIDYRDVEDGRAEKLHKQLNPEQMQKLAIALAAPGIRPLSGVVNLSHIPKDEDYMTNLDLAIRREHTVQRVTLRGYKTLGESDFPTDIQNLMCVVDELRQANYRITSGCR